MTVSSQPGIVQFLEILVLTDLCQYWIHRAFHRVPLLWRFHEIHHSAETMDWIAGARLHLVDVAVTRGLTYVPIYVLGFDQAPLVVICGDDADTVTLTSAGVGVITVPAPDGRVDLGAALEQLAAAGLHSLLCEGGARLGASLLAEDRVDRLYAFLAPTLLGTGGTAAFPLQEGVSAPRFSIFRIARHGEDALLILDRCLPA